MNFLPEGGRQQSATAPATPPPPYESLLEDDGKISAGYSAATAAAVAGAAPAPDFEIAVVDPVKQGEGVAAYVSYKIATRTTLQQYKRPFSEVIRRFRDFVWLHDKLIEANKGVIVPALPEKNAVQKFQMATDFIEQRRRALQVFINKVAAHPLLKHSHELQAFLEASEEEWAYELARAQVQASGGAKKTLSNVSGWLQTLGHTAQNLVAGKTDDALEDPEYLKVRDYITSLESHLGEAHRQAARLIRKELELGATVGEFGQAVEKLGHLEQGGLQEAFIALGGKSAQLSAASKQRTEALAANFEAPLKEFVRTIRSVQTAVSDRAASLFHLQQCKSDLDSRKVRLNRLRATPGGSQEVKILEAERDLHDAEERVKLAKIAYEAIVARMTEELNRFQKERSADMNLVLRDFALTQAQLARDNAAAWGAFLSDMQTYAAASGASSSVPAT